ncbi:Putative heme degradation protein [Hyphomicrobiales bacterium]|nr:Putative heme degradation protein [Hyphomicrobiales bacterium]CAH1674715.1 putative heme degradation protein [Hyphomicrobiales bacterium]
MTTETPVRADLGRDASAVLHCLPQMGSVMLTARHGGATHERIGPVEAVSAEDGIVRCRGAAHDSRIHIGEVASVVVDRSGRMKDMVLPRLDFQDAGGEVLFSIIGMAGLEPFDRGLAPLGAGTPLPEPEKPVREPATFEEGDPGTLAFEAAREGGEPISITLTRPGVVQTWQGVVAAVKPGMGFINVMQPDFHLHLRGGSVAGWRRRDDGDAIVLEAENADGDPIGLSVRGPAVVFSTF